MKYLLILLLFISSDTTKVDTTKVFKQAVETNKALEDFSITLDSLIILLKSDTLRKK